jgi:hypothetical protein
MELEKGLQPLIDLAWSVSVCLSVCLSSVIPVPCVGFCPYIESYSLNIDFTQVGREGCMEVWVLKCIGFCDKFKFKCVHLRVEVSRLKF